MSPAGGGAAQGLGSDDISPDQFFASYLDQLWSDRPVLASDLGLTGYDAELGDFSADAFEQRSRSARQWAGRLDRLGWTSGAALDLPDRVDAKLLAAHLAGEQVMSTWEPWRRDPDAYLSPCLWGVSTLFIDRLRPEPELVAAAVSRLGQVPGVLECARRQLDMDLASSVILERARSAAAAGARFFSAILPGEVGDDKLRGQLVPAAQGAAEAMESFAHFLAQACSGAKGSFALGEDRYSALLRDKELLGMDAGQLGALGQRCYEALEAELSEVSVRVQPDAAGWREVITELYRHHPESPEALVVAYRQACAQARQFLVERDLVTLPEGEECALEPAPVFWRALISVASYHRSPPFAPGARGIFFVPHPPPGASDEAVQQLLANNAWSSVPSIAVHEAYPGHHWHLSWAKSNPRPLRQAVRTPYFSEGWALYAEAMMRRQGFFHAAEHEFDHLQQRIFRAARIVVDTSLHSGAMSFDEAVAFMTDKANLTPTVARAEVARYCAWPTQAASYLTGALEIDGLLQRWTEGQRGSLREFHEAVAASPGLPPALVAEEIFSPR